MLKLADHWYALRVRSNHEKSVRAQLSARDHDVFLPLYSSKHRWADRWKTVSVPLFPGYVFCRCDIQQRSEVLTTTGVIDIVRTGSQPAPIETREIEAIRRIVDSPLMAEPYAGLIRGQMVTMTDGPLTGLTGTLTEFRKNMRLVISVELLQRSVLVEIENGWVAPCGPAPALYPQLLSRHAACVA